MTPIGWRPLAAVAIAAVFAGALTAVAVDTGAAGETAQAPVVLRQDGEGFRYTYHVPTGAEALFEIAVDPHELHDVRRLHPDAARALRQTLERRIGVRSLGELRPSNGAAAERLHRLGYL